MVIHICNLSKTRSLKEEDHSSRPGHSKNVRPYPKNKE
jgi:hypothetical protein